MANRPTPPDRAQAADTMAAWERFLTGGGAMPAGNFVVSSWQRSRAHGIDPTSRAAPIAAAGAALRILCERNATLIGAAHEVLARGADLLAGARTILILTDPEGVVLEVAGDRQTEDQGQLIHLMRGGQWGESRIGTNGIGTALATRRPAQVHAAEHYCEGIKAWTCAAAPVFDPISQALLGVVDISGPPTTYQRSNLNLAVATAREIEAVIAERAMRARAALFEACLERLSARDAAGLVAIDRRGRLLHTTGRVAMPVALGQPIPGLDETIEVADWAARLPPEWRADWFRPVTVKGETVGALLVVPQPKSPRSPHGAASEADPARMEFAAIVGASPVMRDLLDRARVLAGRNVPVLIEGETGTGKELLARAIHGAADPTQPFVVFNCGAVTRDLVAAELFGHVRGAFTGATAEGRAGRFELADGGVLCLDEVGEMPPDIQPFLLRVLEEGIIYRVGDTQPRSVRVRLISMTNRNLEADVAAGRFRRDLFYRIGVTRLTIPPLRARGGDVGSCYIFSPYCPAPARARRGRAAAGRIFQPPVGHSARPSAAPLHRRGAGAALRPSLAGQCARTEECGGEPAPDDAHGSGHRRGSARRHRCATGGAGRGTRHHRGCRARRHPPRARRQCRQCRRGGTAAGGVAQHSLSQGGAVRDRAVIPGRRKADTSGPSLTWQARRVGGRQGSAQRAHRLSEPGDQPGREGPFREQPETVRTAIAVQDRPDAGERGLRTAFRRQRRPVGIERAAHRDQRRGQFPADREGRQPVTHFRHEPRRRRRGADQQSTIGGEPEPVFPPAPPLIGRQIGPSVGDHEQPAGIDQPHRHPRRRDRVRMVRRRASMRQIRHAAAPPSDRRIPAHRPGRA